MPSYCLLIAGVSINHFICMDPFPGRHRTLKGCASRRDAENTQRIKSQALTSEWVSVRVRLPFLGIKANLSEAQTNSSRERRSSRLICLVPAFPKGPGMNPFVLFSANL